MFRYAPGRSPDVEDESGFTRQARSVDMRLQSPVRSTPSYQHFKRSCRPFIWFHRLSLSCPAFLLGYVPGDKSASHPWTTRSVFLGSSRLRFTTRIRFPSGDNPNEGPGLSLN